jgi:dTMP kinase
MKRGRFITFEGPEGSGKTTQAHRLVEQLETAGLDVIYTREPGGTRTGEAIRGILQYDTTREPICPRTEVLLFAASRAQLVHNVILPALEKGTWVISDRFADSTTVYQGYGRGFPIKEMLAINTFAIAEAVPDATLLLDVPVDVGFERLQERIAAQGSARDRIENEARDFHERVRRGYLELAEREPERFHCINGSASPGEVSREVWKIIDGYRA